MLPGSLDVHRWGVILAGGEGSRLKSLTRLVSGEDTPKQFCHLLGGRSLLTNTQERLAGAVASDRTLYVLLNAHERFYRKELRGVSANSLIEQPSNHGTLPAILCSLVRIIQQDKDAIVGFFPSDHHYRDEDKFLSGIDLAYRLADSNRDSVILLGVAAGHAEKEYGWIEAEASVSTLSRNGLLRVKRFWEKPSERTAQDLLERGAVWNTFVMIGRAQAFLEMIESQVPEIYNAFRSLMAVPQDAWNTSILTAVYDRLPVADFSMLILSCSSDRLGVLCLGDVGWSDLGDPSRVITVLSREGVKNHWMSEWQERRAAVAVAG